MSDQSGDDPGHASEEPENFGTPVEVLETEFRTFRAEFSNFRLENASIDIQADLDNVQRAQFIMNETLMSKMDAFDNKIDKMDAFNRELSSQMNDLCAVAMARS